MENSSTITLKDLLKQEKTLRTSKNNTESLAKCIEIITYIENSPSDTIYNTLSSIISNIIFINNKFIRINIF